MLRRDFLKALQMLARRLHIAFALKSARDTEFRRGVIRKRGERFSEIRRWLRRKR